MAVDTPSALYNENLPKWRKCRDFVAGAEAVKKASCDYVPRPSGLDDAEFDAYIARGSFFNATQRTVDSLVGLVMAKPPEVEMGGSLAQFSEYFDGAGSTAEDFARDAVLDVLVTGGGCGVVDRPSRPDGILTRQQEVDAGLRPYAAWYPLESVLEYRYGTIAGKRELVFLKLAETWEDLTDEWTSEFKPQIRVYDMLDGGARVRVFRQDGSGWNTISDGMLIKSNGQAFPYVPAVMFGPVKNEPEKPPILDLVEVNRAHWQNSVDLENVLHFVGSPMLLLTTNDDFEGKPVRVGSSTATILEQGADAKYVSLGDDADSALVRGLDRKEAQMAALGARMLMPDGGAAESGEALAIRRGGENSALGKVADSVSRCMELLIETMGEWEGLNEAVSFRLNTNYLPNTITAQELTAAIAAVDRSLMSQQQFFDMLKAGGIVRDDMTYEEHQEQIGGMADRPGLGNGDD